MLLISVITVYVHFTGNLIDTILFITGSFKFVE